MRREIEMPRLSEAVEEGVLVTWLVEPGATVREGDLIAEIQVESSSAEVRAPAAGRMASLLAGQGDVVAQGAPIAVLETAEPGVPAGAGASPASGPSAGPSTAATPSPSAASSAPSAPTGGIVASPATRRVARELGVDLGSVSGSGPGGRILESDVVAAAGAASPGGTAASPGGTAAAPGGTAAAPGGTAAASGIEPFSAMRRTIAERLHAGLTSTAQLTITAEADVTELASRLPKWSAVWGRRASYTEAIVLACALALRDHPRLAATWTDRGLAVAERIDIGITVALPEGLIVPVARDADRKDLRRLGDEIAELAARARAGTLSPVDTEGACFSVMNLGGYRIDAFTPLLDPPQTAILGVGRARPRPAVVDVAVMVRTLVVLSLTFDHRVVDGAPAAAFLDAVVGLLERPDRLRP